MSSGKIILIGILVVILLILLYNERNKGISKAKFKVKLPYKLSIIPKEKYNLSHDIVLYNETAIPPERFFAPEYKCQRLRKHLYSKFADAISSAVDGAHNIKSFKTPINTLINSILNIRNSADPYSTGSDEHEYFIRACDSDFNEVFISNGYVYIT